MLTSRMTLLYLDAGTSSVLLAALAGGAAGLRLYVASLREKLSARRRRDAAPAPSTTADE